MKTFYVTAFRFGKDGWSYPARVELDGVSYRLSDQGLRVNVRRGGMICRILALTDGARTFHLRSDNRGSSWTLVKSA